MLLCYITDRMSFTGDLLDHIGRTADAGVDFIQLREKDLPARELEQLAMHAVRRLQGTRARLLINGRTDIAIAVGAHGVHLPARDIAASDARSAFVRAGVARPFITVACHSVANVLQAWSHAADAALFAPVFSKNGAALAATQLEELAQACAAVRMPVLALGGVTLKNAASAGACGAAGFAGISLFQSGDLAETVRQLRRLGP